MLAALLLLLSGVSKSAAGDEERQSAELTIAVGGDVMLGRVTERGWQTHGGKKPFGAHEATLRDADVAFVNLEMGVCRSGRTRSKLPLLWAPPKRLDTLREAGIDGVSVANNHALDCGPQGLEQTRRELERRGMVAAGVGPTGVARLQRDVIVLAATLHPPPYRSDKLRPLVALKGDTLVAPVRALRAAHPKELLIVSLHWGREGAERPAASQRRLGRNLVAAGANAVVGHGSHTRQPIEYWRDGVILYSLGNLVFDDKTRTGRPRPPIVLRFRRTTRGYQLLAVQESGGSTPPANAPLE